MAKVSNNIRGNCILITGANGFLGRSIFDLFQASGLSVLATDLAAVSSGVSNTFYKKADITKWEEIKPTLEDATTVIHAAGLAHVFSPDAKSSEKFRLINEIGTENVATAAASTGVRHFVLISSVSVYGPYTDEAYDEQRSCDPVGPYAQSKYNAELRATKIAQKSGMALTIVRLATLYGEGDPGNVGRLIETIDKGRFFWVGNGSNRKGLLYKGDAARAVMAVIQRPASGVNIFNISAPPCTMREIVEGIGDALDKHPIPFRIPASFALYLSRYISMLPNQRLTGLHETVKKWLVNDIYNTRHFEEAYNFQTKTMLKDGLRREVEWYRNNRKMKT